MIRRPVYLIILIDIFAFLLLCFYRQGFDPDILIAALAVIGIIGAVDYVIVKKSMGDEYLFLITAMLTSLGFIMVYRLDRSLGMKQIIWFAGGILLFFAGYFIYTRVGELDRLMFYYTGAAFALFVVTLMFGRNIGGSINWITIGGYSYQPSEVIKVLLVLSLACYYSRSEQKLLGGIRVNLRQERVSGKLLISGMTYVYIGFLLVQREWGTALLLFLIYLALITVFDSTKWLYAMNAVFAAGAALGGYFLVDHIRVRVDMWINPWSDVSGKGYQIIQSLFAIASGGFFGRGLGMGRPDMIPDVNTDFIFSAISEELGLFGGVAVILLYFILCYRGFKIVLTTYDRFDRAVSLGITVMFSIQTFIIIGGVTRLIPLTGITLPFISYGGSSLTTNFLAMGILQAISAGRGRKGGADAVEEHAYK